jgi:hypothetical protein
MGQYWKVLNLDKRQTPSWKHWEKLGECLFDGSPDTLVPLLKQAALHEINSDSALPPEKSWAGDRIICLGDNHEDLPAGLLSTAEQEELDKGDEGEEMRLYQFASEHYQKVKGISAFNPPQLSGGHWILRNLSKDQYVREEAIKVAGVKGMSNNRSSKEIGLGQVVLSRICWSTDDSCAMSYYDKDIYKGVWAGDRFDITTINQIGIEDGRKWTDVSDEVAEEMTKIWVGEYGDEWLKHKVSAL